MNALNRPSSSVFPGRGLRLASLLTAALVGGACTPPGSDADDEDEDDASDESGDDGALPLRCENQMISDLSLVEDESSDGTVRNARDGDDFVSEVDATAGGIQGASTHPWLYLRFTDDGLETVEIDDFEALDSTRWHIAAKRFGIRLNGGNSGPGELEAAPLDGFRYDEVDEVDSDVSFEQDEFYDESCDLIDDGSGLGSPGYVLSPWWSYISCVATSDLPFAIRLPGGELVKFVVESYYRSGQEACDRDGQQGSGAANFTWRWAYL